MKGNTGIDWFKIASKFAESNEPDLTIKCQTEEHRVHKLIMTSASEFFEKACKGPWKVSSNQDDEIGVVFIAVTEIAKEAQTNTVDLPEDNIDIVHAMVSYLYTGTYENVMVPLDFPFLAENRWIKTKDNEEPNDASCDGDYVGWYHLRSEGLRRLAILFHVDVCALADKYGIQGLKKKAEDEIVRIVDDEGLEWDGDFLAWALSDLVDDISGPVVSGMESAAKAFARILSRPHLEKVKSLDLEQIFHTASKWPELSYELMLSRHNRVAKLGKKF